VLATLFIVSSIVLAVLAAGTNKPKTIDTSLATQSAAPAAPAPAAPAPATAPATGVPFVN
jgi:preprotein translocase subunit SecG